MWLNEIHFINIISIKPANLDSGFWYFLYLFKDHNSYIINFIVTIFSHS
jgi:hypothetical protein